MKIEYLSDHEELVPVLAKYNYNEWGKSYCSDVAVVAQRYSATKNTDKIPLTIVALDEDNSLLGFASLIEDDLETRQDLSPWLAALYVLPEHRGKLIGKKLIERIIAEAKRLKIHHVYLFTGDDKKVSYYAKQGWKLAEKFQYKSEDSVIMKYDCDS